MKKSELIDQALNTANTTYGRNFVRADMEKAFESICDVAAAELLGGGDVPLSGLGKLKVRETAPRTGRNPRTGESLELPGGKKVTFFPSKEFKEALK